MRSKEVEKFWEIRIRLPESAGKEEAERLKSEASKATGLEFEAEELATNSLSK